MPTETPDVPRQRYHLHDAWDEHESVTYWIAYDRTTRREVFIQQLHAQTAPAHKGSGPRARGHERKAAARTGGKAGPAAGKGSAAPGDRADVFPPVAPGSLLQQVHAASATGESHLLAVHDMFERDGSLWVVMDPVQPFSLHQLMRDQGRMGASEVSHLGAELAVALGELHDAGLTHGRIDPRNVFFRADRTLALAGYGSKPPTDQDDGPWVRTWRPDSRYTAPELADRTAALPPIPTRSADLWAMGVILHEITTGRRSLLYGPLRRFRWIRKVHDARPPTVAKQPELTLLLALLLSPHPGARGSAGTAAVSLDRLTHEHEPPAAGHWAVPNRAPRTPWQKVRELLVQTFTTATSRAVAAFITGVLVTIITLFGWHLVTRPSPPDAETAVLAALVFGLAYGTVRVLGQICWHGLALVRPRFRPPAGPPPPDRRPAAGAPGTERAPGEGAPDDGVPPGLPACTPRLVLRWAPVRVGSPVRLEFTLDVPAGHPWHREPGEAEPPAELMLVASTLAAGAILTPALLAYRVQDPEAGPAGFEFTALESGAHVVRITVYERLHGVVLQELHATLLSEEPALLGPARHEATGS
ncbi:protein kinase [Streptomyces sp. RerS4]|uniref:protein kinase domain-containing protein n=1 Tax=Streptomyces sp. RerS4 TaxID=2942449 RepID=UPI00201C5E56|nr:protein kinase [Streptomyces sp. RerS4]UQX03635.1 protein kinase [Streptomyces sp. RerS4]